MSFFQHNHSRPRPPHSPAAAAWPLAQLHVGGSGARRSRRRRRRSRLRRHNSQHFEERLGISRSCPSEACPACPAWLWRCSCIPPETAGGGGAGAVKRGREEGREALGGGRERGCLCSWYCSAYSPTMLSRRPDRTQPPNPHFVPHPLRARALGTYPVCRVRRVRRVRAAHRPPSSPRRASPSGRDSAAPRVRTREAGGASSAAGTRAADCANARVSKGTCTILTAYPPLLQLFPLPPSLSASLHAHTHAHERARARTHTGPPR